MKNCTSKNCSLQNPQPLDNFSKNKSTKDGLQDFCRSCNVESKKKYREKDKTKLHERLFQKKYLLQKKYNLSIDQYNLLKLTQANTCKICGKNEITAGRSLAVDHDHKNGKVRGLLCR